MTQKILPGDFLLLTDNAVIRTKCPPDLVTDEMVAQRCHAVNLSAGDNVVVQCFDHTQEILLAWATYLVVGRVERKKTVEIDDRQSNSFAERKYTVECIVPWRVPAALQEAIPIDPIIPPAVIVEQYVPTEARRIWNPSRQTHEIRRVDNDELLGQHKDKETAERIAAGELALP